MPGRDRPDAARYPVPVPASACPIGRTGRWRAAAVAAARELRTGLRHRAPRTPESAAAEYEARWAGQRAQSRWSASRDLRGATRLSSYGSRTLQAMMEFRAYQVGAPAYFEWRARKLATVVGAHATGSEPVVELGCGLGKNLLALAAHGHRELVGLDVSRSAVAAVAEQFRHYRVPGQVRLADARRLSRAGDLVAGSTVLTVYVLEQLPRDGEQVLRQLAAAGPRQVLHIEPAPDRLPGRRAWERLPSRMHCWARNYHTTLLRTLARLQAAGALRVTEVTPLGFSPYLFHSPVLVRWVPGVRG